MSRFDDVQNVCLRRGILFPTAEIYQNIAGFYDYGHIGTLLKRNLVDYWREFFVDAHDFIIETEGSVILPEKVFESSGHLESFIDPITQCTKCSSIFRADHLIEESSGEFVEGKTEKELDDIISSHKIKCPKCKGSLGNVRVFNLMLKTEISPAGGQVAYMRPETAQNIFTSFPRLFKTSRKGLPFGVSQTGHSFRNEISPRQFIIRLREFNQCEIELFFDPENEGCPIDNLLEKQINILTRDAQKNGKEYERMTIGECMKAKVFPSKWIAYFLAKEFDFYKSLGIPEDAIRFRHMQPEETPHYSKGNFDLEIKFDFGWKEVVGNSYRTDHDLKNHMKGSGTDMHVVTEDGKKIIPHVIEPSFGIERTIAAVLLYNFRPDKHRGWEWFAFPPKLSPYIAAVYPLVKKDKLPEIADEIYGGLKGRFKVFYDEKGSIGKRYARADEIGTYCCITVDNQTLSDDTVTVRMRDNAKQQRIKKQKLAEFLEKSLA